MAIFVIMKKILFSLVCIIMCSQIASAQKEMLQLDEANKYVYYQVVDKQGVAADTLFQRGSYFIKMANPKSKTESVVANTIITKGKFLVYNGSSVAKKEGGEISYTLHIETKDQKYRYKISDFIFTPYTRDRFNNMVPMPGIEVPIEKLTSKYSQKEADNYLNQTGMFCQATSRKLKQHMDKTSTTKMEEPIKKVVTDKW
jgi:hypothetical protein